LSQPRRLRRCLYSQPQRLRRSLHRQLQQHRPRQQRQRLRQPPRRRRSPQPYKNKSAHCSPKSQVRFSPPSLLLGGFPLNRTMDAALPAAVVASLGPAQRQQYDEAVRVLAAQPAA